MSPRKSRPPSAKSTSGSARDGLADERRHPLAPELVAVAVEEDVASPSSTGCGREELGVGAPEDGLRPARAELEQPLEPALRVRDHEVVLARVGAVVVVEARVHAAELGQAHRHVAVVEDDRDRRSARAARVGMPRKCAIGTVKTTTASGRSRSTSRSRCRRQRGVTTRQIVSRVTRSASESAGASSPRRRWRSPFSRARSLARARVRLALDDRPGSAAARHQGVSTGRPRYGVDDQVDALLVQPLPELPPRRACSRSGSRDRPPRRRRGAWARARR